MFDTRHGHAGLPGFLLASQKLVRMCSQLRRVEDHDVERAALSTRTAGSKKRP